jgi:hypothetical protein
VRYLNHEVFTTQKSKKIMRVKYFNNIPTDGCGSDAEPPPSGLDKHSPIAGCGWGVSIV